MASLWTFFSIIHKFVKINKIMTDANKKNLITGSKVLTLVIVAFVALITNVEIWNCFYNGDTDGFHLAVSIVNFIGEFIGIYFLAKKVLFKQME